MTDLTAVGTAPAPGKFSLPELMPGVPIIPPGKRHLITSRFDFERDFPIRAEMARRLEDNPLLALQEPRLFLRWKRKLMSLNGLDLYVEREAGSNSSLREGQLPVFQSFSSFLEAGGTDGYVKLPPRTGKTIIYIYLGIALALKEQGEKLLVVEPSKLLAEQAKRSFGQFAPELAVKCHYGSNKTVKPSKQTRRLLAELAGKNGGKLPCTKARGVLCNVPREQRLEWGALPDVTVITRDSLRNLETRGVVQPGDFRVISIDEGHEILGPKTSRSIDRLRSEDSHIFAFTATPSYSTEKNLRRFLGPEIHSMGIQEAISLRLLAPFSFVTAETDIDLSEIDVDPKEGYNPKQLARAIDQIALNKSVIQLLQQPDFIDKSALVFSADTTHSKEILKLCTEAGISAESVAGVDGDGERERKLKGHRDGTIRVLISPKLLGTGYDNPRVEVTIITVPFTSPVPVEQYSTRSLTPDPGNPGKVGIIVQYLHKDRNKQRRQTTFLDCVYGAEIDRYIGREPRTKGKPLELRSITVEGIKVSTKPQEVARVLGKRPIPVPPHELDEVQAKVRELTAIQEGVLLAVPGTLTALIRGLKGEMSSHSVELLKALRHLRKKTKSAHEQNLNSFYSTKFLAFRHYSEGEAIRHFHRKNDVPMPELPEKQIRRVLGKGRNRIVQCLEELEPHTNTLGVTPKAALSFLDERIHDPLLEAPWTKEAHVTALQEAAGSVLPKIKAIEAKLGMRWDVVLRLSAELETADADLFEITHRDYSGSIVSFAKSRVAEFIAERVKGIDRIDAGGDHVLFQQSTEEDLVQVATIAGVEVFRRPKLFSTIRRFSRTAANAIEKALEAYVKQASAELLSFSPGAEAFKTYDDLLTFQEYMQAEYHREGAYPSEEMVGKKYKLPVYKARRMVREAATSASLASIAGGSTAFLPEGGTVSMDVSDHGSAQEAFHNEIDERLLHATIDELLSTLEPRQAQVLRMRYGLGGVPVHSFLQISEFLKLTQNAVRAIEAKAIRRLQHPDRAERLEEFVGG